MSWRLPGRVDSFVPMEEGISLRDRLEGLEEGVSRTAAGGWEVPDGRFCCFFAAAWNSFA